MKSLLMLLILTTQPTQYDQITVERIWIVDAIDRQGVIHDGTKGEPFSEELAVEIATEFLTELARKTGCILPVFQGCKELDQSVLPVSAEGPHWSVRFQVWYQGIRIDDYVTVVVSTARVHPGNGFLYRVVSASIVDECQAVSEEDATRELCPNGNAEGVPSNETECVVELVWHYRTLPVSSDKILYKYWKYIDVLDEGGIVPLVSYCDGSVIPDYVN